MPLFHASKSEFLVGQIIEAKEPTNYYSDAITHLEKTRPHGAPSRSTCIFASDSDEFAVFFLLRQRVPITEIRLYEVELPIQWKSPFAIIHALHRRIENSLPTNTLASEYWQSNGGWKFHEFFGPQMTIKRSIPTPDVNEVILTFQYDVDICKAKTL